MSPGIPRTPDPEVFGLIADWAAADPDQPAATIAAVVEQVARSRHLDVALELNGVGVKPSAAVAGIDGGATVAGRWGPWLPGFAREALESPHRRKRMGIHHTPPRVVAEILDLAETAVGPFADVASVLDPAAGGGAFLLAAAERMAGAPADIVERLWAVDIDPLALATCRASLALWAGHPPPADQFVLGDYLTPEVVAALPAAVDRVVGNPPFLAQLRDRTARGDAARGSLRGRWPDVGRYVDDAAAFLLAATEQLAPGGAVALVQPSSLLAAADAEPVRRRLSATAPPRAVWVDHERSFAAGVDTVAVVAAPGPATEVVVAGERTPLPGPASWGAVLARAQGVPGVPAALDADTLGSIATITAGFRDQYYGLVDAVSNDPNGRLRLITAGLIDPLRDRWGRRPCRFAKQAYTHPAVALDRVDPSIRAWVGDRLRPKVLVASQTRVIEAIADPHGEMVPSVPVVSVEPSDAAPSLWHVVALLTCPVATTRLHHAAAGTALSAAAIRVSARRLAELPLPADPGAWAQAAAAAERGDVDACGVAMLAAHRLADRHDLLDFWRANLPNPTAGGPKSDESA